ncbi:MULTISPECIES: ferredoxin [unclassified Roseovarius]|uniref:ferredoxin n=1 Tax=unclassified Roseovarius TaxID=2614913 RepID=UPI00273F4F27|nr:ferredoxin [Roseovarius sp. MMSF_3350]
MITLDTIERAAAPHHLAVFGTVTGAETPKGIGTLVLLGPREPGFWPAFTASPEYADAAPDPMDRWSSRVIGGLAQNLDATAFFPFGGPPYQPFISWAKASGRAHGSPVGLLVHDTAGLMISYRGALGFADRLNIPVPPPNPCDSCATRPCLTACPVDAFASGTYDIAACKADLDRPENDCMSKGCAVRRACPVSQSYGRLENQSAFHMRAFK